MYAACLQCTSKSTNLFLMGIKYLLWAEMDFTRKLIWGLQNIILRWLPEKKILHGSDEKKCYISFWFVLLQELEPVLEQDLPE